jgi:hypothetical protein
MLDLQHHHFCSVVLAKLSPIIKGQTMMQLSAGSGWQLTGPSLPIFIRCLSLFSLFRSVSICIGLDRPVGSVSRAAGILYLSSSCSLASVLIHTHQFLFLLYESSLISQLQIRAFRTLQHLEWQKSGESAP